MRRWIRHILYVLCILGISTANPTKAPYIIKDNEEIIKFQNKLPEEPLDSETGVVGRPPNVTKHGIDQSPSREKKKHDCPFCQYASNIEASLKNQQELDSDSPYLIIGNVKPADGNPNIITEEDTQDNNNNNSTWIPQNEIKAILKIPDGDSANKEFKRCTHSGNVLGGSLQKTELDNDILNNPELLNNIDFSCCSTLRRILLHALKLEGKCLCSGNRATSPIINITAIRDNEYENGVVQQEILPMFKRQQQNTPPKFINQETGAGNNDLLGKEDTQIIKENRESHGTDTSGIQADGNNGNDNSVSIGMPDFTTNSDGSTVTLNNLNTSLVADEKNYSSSIDNEKMIDGKKIIRAENEVLTSLENADLITEPIKHTKPLSEDKVEDVDTTDEFSRVKMFGQDVPSVGKNIINSSIELNEKLEQISKGYPEKSYPKVNHSSTKSTNNEALELYDDQEHSTNNLGEELNKNGEKIDKFTIIYTTEPVLGVVNNGDPFSTLSPDNLLEINMQFGEGITQNIQAPMQVGETQTSSSILMDNNTELDKNKGNEIDSKEINIDNHDPLQSHSESNMLGNEHLEKTIFVGNELSSAKIKETDNSSTKNYTEDWGGENSMSTMTYELGQTLEIDNLHLEEDDPKNNTVNPITTTTSPSIIPTVPPQISEEPSNNVDNTVRDQDKDSKNIFNSSQSVNKGNGPSAEQDEDGNMLGQSAINRQNESKDNILDDKNFNPNGENSTNISSINTPEHSTHLFSPHKQNSSLDDPLVQPMSFTENFIGDQITEGVTSITPRDVSHTLEVSSNTTETHLQEAGSSTSGSSLRTTDSILREVEYVERPIETTETYLQEAGNSTSGSDLFITDSILQEIESTELPTGYGISIDDTLNVNYSDIPTNNRELSSKAYLLGNGSPPSKELNLMIGNQSEIHLNDSMEYGLQLIPKQLGNISQHSQKSENIPLDGPEPGNLVFGSIQAVSASTQPTDSSLEEEIWNLTTESPIIIELNDPLGNNQQPEPTKLLNHQSQDNSLVGLETDNFMLGSIQTESSPTQPTDYPLEGEIWNLTTETPTVMKLGDLLGISQPVETEAVNYQPRNDQDNLLNGLQVDKNIPDSISTESTQRQPTDNPLGKDILNLTNGGLYDMILNSSKENNQSKETQKIETNFNNGQRILSDSLESDSYILESIQTSGIESSTLPIESKSPLGLNFVDMDTGTEATTPLDSSMLSQLNKEKTNQNRAHTSPSTEAYTSELLPSTEKMNVNEVPVEDSTEIDQEMDKAENILKMLMDSFKKTHLKEGLNEEELSDNPKMTSMEASTYYPILGNINQQEFPKKSENEDLTKIETYTDKSEIIEQHSSNFESDTPGDNVDTILQNAKINTSTDGNFFEPTKMSSDSITATSTSNVNITDIQYSSDNISKNVNMVDYDKYLDEINELHKFSTDNNQSTEIESLKDSSDNNTSSKMSSDNKSLNLTSNYNTTDIHNSSEINTSKIDIKLVDYDKYFDEINELHKVSAENQSPIIENLEYSSPGSTLPPDLNSQTFDAKDTTEEPSLSIINLFTSRPINDDELKQMSYNTESTSIGSETDSYEDLRQTPQKMPNPNFVSLLPNEFEIDTTHTMDQESEFDKLSNYPEQTTKISVWNDMTSEIGVISTKLSENLPSISETQVNILNSTDLEEEILSTGNYIVHHVNVSRNEDFQNLNNNTQEISKFNMNSENMKLEEFETTTMIMKYQERIDSDLGSSHLTLNSSDDSKFIESTNIESVKYSDDTNINLAQTPKPTGISEFEIHSINRPSDNKNTNLANIPKPSGSPQMETHSPLIVCFPQEDSHQFNNDLLDSRFFIQNDANIIEFDLVRRDMSLCGCPPHSSYELKPKSHVSKTDINLLRSLEGQHISKILRRGHTVPDKTTDNYETIPENDNLRKDNLDSHVKGMRMSSSYTSEKLDVNNEDSENQAVRNTRFEDDQRRSDNLEEKPTCNCQCLGNVNPTKFISKNRKESQKPEKISINGGGDEILESQNGKLESENNMNDRKEERNYKRKNNKGRQQSMRLDFPIMVDKDILRRFQSVYRPYNYYRRS